MINDILDISKMQSGRYALDAREVELSEILNASLADYRRNALDLGLNLEGQFAGNVPPVRGDPDKLRQVFNNLISNAIKFTPPGGSVRVVAKALDDGGAAVSVRDTGVGMTEEEIQLSLTPFAQVDASHSRWREGAGLGLPIAKALVQLHGGSLEVHSAKSLGTEVTVRLPSRLQISVMRGRDALLGSGGNGAL